MEDDTKAFLDDVLSGLGGDRKTLPSKYFYDEAGSRLFAAICALEAYYPTRTEMAVLKAHGGGIARLIGPDALIVEYGAGSLDKIRVLLDAFLSDALAVPAGLVAVDISKTHLMDAVRGLRRAYPGLAVHPVAADFTKPVPLPALPQKPARRVAFFPGSTIGNFDPEPAVAFMKSIADTVGDGGGLLIGVDLQKDEERLIRAYDDAAGVTRDFNLNLLVRMNRELGADFDPARFRHVARYDSHLGRIEMHLESLANQTARIAGRAFDFTAGETIHTENSYKYTLDGFDAMAARAGFSPCAHWTDAERLFAVIFYQVEGASG